MKCGLSAVLALGLILCLSGAPVQRSEREASSNCAYDQFWNEDNLKCLSCTLCKNQSKTPGCDTCPRECKKGMFWNFDTQRCISCEICKSQPNTPQCSICQFKAVTSTPQPAQETDVPVWMWVLIATVTVIVPLAVGVAWYKSKEFEPSEVAKPVQEIGIGEGAEHQMLTSD